MTTTAAAATTTTMNPAAGAGDTAIPNQAMQRQRSTEDDRIALVSNLPKEATALTLRHYLNGIMARQTHLRRVGAEPPISSIRFLIPAEKDVATASGSQHQHQHRRHPDDSTKTALVEFATSQDCHIAVSMLQKVDDHNTSVVDDHTHHNHMLSFQGKILKVEKLTENFHVDHAERDESLRRSVNKRSNDSMVPPEAADPGPAPAPATKTADLESPKFLKKEVERLEKALTLEQATLNQTRDDLLEEQNRQVTVDEMLVNATSAVLSRTREALANEQAERIKLVAQVAQLEKLLVQAQKEIGRLSQNALRRDEQSDLQEGRLMSTGGDDDDPITSPPPPLENVHPRTLQKVLEATESSP